MKSNDIQAQNKSVKLDTLRCEIDAIDRQLLDLFQKRMNISKNIALYKSENGLAVFDPIRETAKLNDIYCKSCKDFSEYNKEFFTVIMNLSKDYQNKILSGL